MSKLILEKWTDCFVSAGREPAPETVDEFERVLNDAVDERPLQKLFAASPMLLGALVPPGRDYWCLDRPKLGAEYIPDFLLASITSIGFQWVAIELENPNMRLLTKAGLPTAKLSVALSQVRDWRIWLTDNIFYAREERGLKDIDGNCKAFIITGRRNTLDSKQIKRYRALSSDGTTVMTYDRLHDTVRNSIKKKGWHE